MDQRVTIALILLVGSILIGPIWYLENAFLVTMKITIHQVTFWALLVAVPVGNYLLKKYKQISTGWPFIFLWPAFITVYFTVGVFYTTGIADKSNFNAQAIGGAWEESYTSIRTETTCTGRDKDGNCTSSVTNTYCDNHHPDVFKIEFSDGSTHRIGSTNYRNLVTELKNERQVPNSNFDQCSIGDGRKFRTDYIGGKSSELYVTYEKPVVNYILAGNNLYQTSAEVAKPYLGKLERVPSIVEHPAGIGPWMSHRVITKGVQVPSEWKQRIEAELNRLNGSFGPSKEVNVVIYVVDEASREFTTALDAYWIHGRKNQLTIVVGSINFPKIEWVDVIDFWSVKPEIRINLRDQLQVLSLDDPKLMTVIRDRVQADWERRQMKTFEYLSWGIVLPWWLYPLVIAFCLIMSILFSRLIEASLEGRNASNEDIYQMDHGHRGCAPRRCTVRDHDVQHSPTLGGSHQGCLRQQPERDGKRLLWAPRGRQSRGEEVPGHAPRDGHGDHERLAGQDGPRRHDALARPDLSERFGRAPAQDRHDRGIRPGTVPRRPDWTHRSGSRVQDVPRNLSERCRRGHLRFPAHEQPGGDPETSHGRFNRRIVQDEEASPHSRGLTTPVSLR
ncbi:MAG: hypothetical protein HHAS10_03530 [Candidatus Altimarinota bacterium]